MLQAVYFISTHKKIPLALVARGNGVLQERGGSSLASNLALTLASSFDPLVQVN